jgi:uncharacterized protein (DUF302 family)
VKVEDGSKMTTKTIEVQRWSVTSSKPFAGVVAAVDAAVGHPDMREFSAEIAAARTAGDLQAVVQRSLGKSGFMEFARFDLGVVLKKELGELAPDSLHLVIGNPLIMKEMVKHVPDAGSYAPVTLLIDERPDGVHLSYNTMVSLLTPYGNADALKVAQDLDSKVARLLAEVAS